MKIGRAFSQLGQKVDKSFNKLGDKGNSALNKVKKDIGNVPGEVNHLAKNIVLNSGAVTDGLRVGTGIGDQILSGAVSMGAGAIPVYGQYIAKGQIAMKALHKGAVMLDNKRDQEEARLRRNAANDQINNAARERSTNIEKMNGRKLAILGEDTIPSAFA